MLPAVRHAVVPFPPAPVAAYIIGDSTGMMMITIRDGADRVVRTNRGYSGENLDSSRFRFLASKLSL